MIATLVFYVFFGFANLVLRLLPVGSFSTVITDSLTTAFDTAYAYNIIFPLDTLFSLLAITATFWGAYYIWLGGKWLIHLIRGN